VSERNGGRLQDFVDDPSMAAEMHAHFTDAEVVELGMFTGLNLVLRRVGVVLSRRVDTAAYASEMAS